MSNFTNFSLSVEKGLRGNIGKMTVVKKNDGTAFMNMMLFLVANGDNKDAQSQIVNVYFPQASFEELKHYCVRDYIRVYFNRIDLAKGVNSQSGQEVLYISAKATGIEMLKKAEGKKTTQPETQSEKSVWNKK